MSRVKRGFKARKRRKNLLKLAKGFRGSRKNRFKTAVHVVRRALCFAYRDRRTKKREFRSLWIMRINAGARAHGMKYSQFMHGLSKAGIELDRSVIADLAINDTAAFANLVAEARAAIETAKAA